MHVHKVYTKGISKLRSGVNASITVRHGFQITPAINLLISEDAAWDDCHVSVARSHERHIRGSSWLKMVYGFRVEVCFVLISQMNSLLKFTSIRVRM